MIALRFETFGEKDLERMLSEAKRFVTEASQETNITRRWLTFLGSSGAGKTFLVKQIMSILSGCRKLSEHADLLSGIALIDWSDTVDELRDQQYWKLKDAIHANLLVIDDICAEHGSPFSIERLCHLLNKRLGLWTLMTGNVTLKELAALDSRIASRIIRPPNVLVVVRTIDYALRK